MKTNTRLGKFAKFLTLIALTAALLPGLVSAQPSPSKIRGLFFDPTDCSTNLVAVYQTLCMDLDDGALWVCSTPGAGGNTSRCDSAGEWKGGPPPAAGIGGTMSVGKIPKATDADTLEDSGITATKGTVNNLIVTGGATGDPVAISVGGTDTHSALQLAGKGTEGPVLIGPDDGMAGFVADMWTPFDSSPQLVLQRENGYASLALRGTGGSAPDILFASHGGTLATPTATAHPSVLGEMDFVGHDGSNYLYSAVLSVIRAGGGAGYVSSRFRFDLTDLDGTFIGGAFQIEPQTDGSLLLGQNLQLSGLATTGAATGKTIVCADTNGKLYRSSSADTCAN